MLIVFYLLLSRYKVKNGGSDFRKLIFMKKYNDTVRIDLVIIYANFVVDCLLSLFDNGYNCKEVLKFRICRHYGGSHLFVYSYVSPCNI